MKLIISKKFFLFGCLFFCICSMQGQSLIKEFFKLSCPEKSWVITHLCSAKKAFKITTETRRVVDSLHRVTFLDNDPDGGQVDAFRHTYWMARLAQEIPAKSAISLGKKHEKANCNDFKKTKNQNTFIHDKAACDMDLFNNMVGVELGKSNPHLPADSLITRIIGKISQGEMRVVKKDFVGNSLDEAGRLLPQDSIMGIWETKRVLVPSSYKMGNEKKDN